MARPKTGSNGQIERRQERPNLAAFLAKDLAPQIQTALPKHLDGDRMARIALTALRVTPKLNECTPFSFAGAILQAAQLGLEVNTPLGHAYLIPRLTKQRDGSKVMECTLQIGYQGMIELARRSGQVSSIYAFTVHQGDTFEYELGLDPKLKHIPNMETDHTPENMTYVYAVAKLRGDEADRQFVVLPRHEVEKRRARGFSTAYSPWKSDYLAMARKTAVRALFTWLPKSPEMARATVVDDYADGMRGQMAPTELYDAQVIDAAAEVGVVPDEVEPEAPETKVLAEEVTDDD